MKLIKIQTAVILILSLFIWACGDTAEQNKTPKVEKPKKIVVVPEFNADSAYRYVAEQVNFGPRVPNTAAHLACSQYLVGKLKQFGAEVVEQKFKARAYNNTILNGNNIIASYNPDAQKRILLCAHWDSRPYADYDDDPKNHKKPIDGANDGASGVGVLLETARQIQLSPLEIGIDIILFDLEDYGQPTHSDLPQVEDSWCLGSQYWSKSPDKNGERAQFGILLDMVGAENIIFTKEYFSMMYASGVVDKVWKRAAQLGYSNVFVNREAGAVIDDHLYINQNAQIPTIDIIHHVDGQQSFFPHWHTLNDNMDAIDAGSLNIVGEVLLAVIYNE